MERTFDIYAHGEYRTEAGIVKGDSIGEIVDEAMKHIGVTFRAIRAMKLEFNGYIIKLKEQPEAVQ